MEPLGSLGHFYISASVLRSISKNQGYLARNGKLKTFWWQCYRNPFISILRFYTK